MAGDIGLIGKTALEAVKQQYLSLIANVVDDNQVTFTLDAVNSTLVVTSREVALDGSSGAFVNSFTIPYQKGAVSECLPYPLFVDISYPANFSQIRSYLRETYGVVIEERELSTTPTGAGLADSDFVTAPVTNGNLLELYTTTTSGRFLPGGVVRFKVTRANGARAISDVFQQTTRPSVLELVDNLNPQTSKTLFDATDEEVVMEMMKNHFGFEVNIGALTLVPKSLDYTSSTVLITPNPNDVVYKGKGEFIFDKAPISSVLADVLTVNTDYPTTFKTLRNYLKSTYGFNLSEKSFTATDPNKDGFMEGDVIDAPLTPDGYLDLIVTRNSIRWMGRDKLKLQFMKMNPDNPLTILAIDPSEGAHGELYTRQTVVTGAVGAVEYAVVRGTPPVPLDGATGLYEGLPEEGIYTWTVRAKDEEGHIALRTEKVRIAEQRLEAKIQTIMNRHTTFLENNTGQTNNSQQDFYLINPEGIIANNRHFIAATMQEAQPNGDATTEGQSLYILGWLYRYLDTRDTLLLDKAKAAFDAYVNYFYDGLQPPATPERWVCNWIVNGKEPVLSNWPLDVQAPTHSGFKGVSLNFVNGFAQIPHNAPYWGQYLDRVTFAFEGALIWDSIVSGVVGVNPDGSPAWGEDGTVYDIEWMIAWNGFKYNTDGDVISEGHLLSEVGQIQLKDRTATKELKLNFANRQPVAHGGRLIGRNEAQHNRPCHVPVSRAYFGNASDAEQWFCDAAWLLWKETGEQRYYDAFRASLVTILEYTDIDAQDMFFRKTTKAETPFTDGISYSYTYPSNTPITFSRDNDGYINARTETGVQLFMEQNSIWFRLGNESLIRSTYGGLDDEGKSFSVRLTMELSADKNSTDARKWGMMLPSSKSTVQSYDIPLSSMVPLTKEDGQTPYILANTSDVTDWGGTVVEARFEDRVMSDRTAPILHFTIPGPQMQEQFVVSFGRYGDGRIPLDSLVYRASHDFNLRIIDDDGWRWWWMLEATAGQWETKTFNKAEARLSSYQPGHDSDEPRPTEPAYETVESATILLDDSYTDAEFSYYGFNEIPPTYQGGDAYSILYTLAITADNAADIKIGDCTVINPRLDSLAYCPGVIPFSNNYLPDAEQFDGWHGMPYPGYQHPFFYVYADQLTAEEKSVRINNVVDFLYDSQVWYHDTFGIWGPGASAYIWNRWDNIKYGPADTWTMYHWGDGKAWAGYQPRAFFSAVRLIEAMQDVGMEVPERLTTYVVRWLTYLEEFVRQNGVSPTDFPMQSIPTPDEDDFTGHMCGLWLAGSSLAKSLGIVVEGIDDLCLSLFLELERNQVWRPGVNDVMNGGWSPWADPNNNGKRGMAFGFWTGEILRGLSLYSLSKSPIHTPSNARATRNSWSDFRLEWEGNGDGSYLVEFLDHLDPTIVKTKKTAVKSTVMFFTAEEASAAYGTNVDALAFRISAATSTGHRLQEPAVEYPLQTPAVNNSHVVKVVAMGINSLIGGYFNDLSDLSDPGGTGRPGRKDSIAASTFRRRLAKELGLKDWEVMPVMTVVGSSPINPMPYQEGFPATNYWWDPQTNQPGPNLIYADEIIKGLDRSPDYFIECGPGETTGIWFAPENQRPAILAAWRSSNIAMLQWMRANWGNPNLQIWFQGATTSWWGDVAPPREINWIGAHLLRNAQTAMALENIGFKMGSYVPNGGKWETYLNEQAAGMGWVHYTPEGYHAAASEMGEALGKNINRALNPPVWTTMVPPTGLKALKRTDGSIRLSWNPVGARYKIHVLHPQTALLVAAIDVGTNSYVLSVEEQLALFGFEASYAHYMVAVTDAVDGDGPFAEYEGDTADPSLQTPTNLKAVKQSNGDIEFSWDARGLVKYFVRNYWIGNEQSPYLFEGRVDTNKYIFTRAEQIAAYGGEVLYVQAEVFEYDPVNETISTGAYWNGDAEGSISTIQNPTGGTATRDSENNITQMWDALDGTSWQVRQINVANGSVIYSRIVTEPSIVFTAQEQIDAYTFTAGFVQWLVTAYRDNLESAEVGFSHGF